MVTAFAGMAIGFDGHVAQFSGHAGHAVENFPAENDAAAHAGAEYAPTGPEAMTVADAAHLISTITGQSIKHRDIDSRAWIEASVAAGIPADYSDMLALLTETVASGHGSLPNNDVEKATGIPATSFADFVGRTAHQFVGSRK